MTTNRSKTPSVQRASDPYCVTNCSLPAIAHTTQGWTANLRPALDSRNYLFGPQASIRPRCPPSHLVPGFREFVVTVYSLKQALKQLSNVVIGFNKAVSTVSETAIQLIILDIDRLNSQPSSPRRTGPHAPVRAYPSAPVAPRQPAEFPSG